MQTMPETRTYQGASLEELLPQIRADLGAGAVITRRREGVTGGFAGFFGKRCIEVEAQAGAPVQSVPARNVFDAYDTAREPELQMDADLDLGVDADGPVMRSFIEQASPFADVLDDALIERDDVPDIRDEFEGIDLVSAGSTVEVAARASHVVTGDWEQVFAELVDAGLPADVVDALVSDAIRLLAPFDPEAKEADLVRQMLARTVRVEHGWRSKSRTIAIVGPAGAGKTLTVAKLAHAFAERSPFSVRLVSLEPGEGAERLTALTDGLDLDRREADTPEAAKSAVRAPGNDGVVLVDTPPVSAGDGEGLAALGKLLAAARPDETHLIAPAGYDARSLLHLNAAIDPLFPANRILISRIDEAPTAAVPVGISLGLKRPISYVADGRLPTGGLRPADPNELAALVMP
jgi:flagellar biosynthesis protein FlhF